MTQLDASSNRISDLTGLEHATQLTRLDIADNEIGDISPLAGLTNLTILFLAENPIIDMAPLQVILRQNPNLIDKAVGFETDGIWSVSFSPDGTLLASGAFDNVSLKKVYMLEKHR